MYHTITRFTIPLVRSNILLLLLTAIFVQDAVEVMAAFGNEYQLKENEHVIYEEEGYVEI